ncbi:MAG: DNA gyrase C-terminal beta-propeller domain-containing protein, partial [Acidimicrobiales bacterium]
EEIAELESILNDPVKLRGVIKDEMTAIRDRYANERYSEITFDPGDLDIEDLIDDEDIVFTMSNTGYVKTVSVDEFKTQGRGGRGVSGGNLKEEDTVHTMTQTSAHAYLLFFSSRGKVYRLKAHQIPMTSRTARGTALVNLLPLQPEETIKAVVDTRDYETNRYLFFATRLGRVKKTLFNAYDSSLKAGLIAIKLKEDDELVEVRPVNEDQDIFLVTKRGQTIRFSESAVRSMGRTAAGVRGMKFRDSDELVSLSIQREEAKLLTVTSNGFGKRSELDQYPVKGRGGLGVRGMKLTEGKGEVVASFMVGDDDQVFITGTKGTIIRMAVADISVQGRSATGVRVMNVVDGSAVAAVAPVFVSDQDDDDHDDESSTGFADDSAEDLADSDAASGSPDEQE